MRSLPWTYLEDESTEVAGITVHGSPWIPRLNDWAFMANNRELADRWALIPDKSDILLTHCPPFGFSDRTYRGGHAGSRSLLTRTLKLKRLKLHVFSHIHEDATAYWRGKTIVANVTHVDGDYMPRYPVRVVEL